MLFYIGFKSEVNMSLERDYFRGSKLLDESYQICLSGLHLLFRLYPKIQNEL